MVPAVITRDQVRQAIADNKPFRQFPCETRHIEAMTDAVMALLPTVMWEGRAHEMGTYRAMGIPPSTRVRVVLAEGDET